MNHNLYEALFVDTDFSSGSNKSPAWVANDSQLD